jgi:hypothetical protein
LWNHAVNTNTLECAVKILIYLFFGLGQFLIPTAGANDSACFSIQNPDKKNVCLAMSKKQNSYCYSVKDHDTKNMCLANVMAQQSYCYTIKSHDMKQQCLAQVK